MGSSNLGLIYGARFSSRISSSMAAGSITANATNSNVAAATSSVEYFSPSAKRRLNRADRTTRVSPGSKVTFGALSGIGISIPYFCLSASIVAVCDGLRQETISPLSRCLTLPRPSTSRAMRYSPSNIVELRASPTNVLAIFSLLSFSQNWSLGL